MAPIWPVALLLTVAGPPAAPLTALRDLGPALSACFRPPLGSAGSEVTVRFSLTRDGAVLGRPTITFSHLLGRPDDKAAFVASVLGGLSACTPLHLSPALGGAIAGRPLTIRFTGGERGNAI